MTLPLSAADGEVIQHNQTRITSRGVVDVSPGHPDDLPHWLLAAMRFLAHCESVYILCVCLMPMHIILLVYVYEGVFKQFYYF